jgi:hypothetical protein
MALRPTKPMITIQYISSNFRVNHEEEVLPVFNRIKVFENTETEKMEVDIIKPVKTKPFSKAFDMFEKKGIIIGQVLHLRNFSL